MQRLRTILLAVGLAGLLGALLEAGPWQSKPSARLRTIRAARYIASHRDFAQRVALPGGRDELSHLAETFNEMLSSLEEAYRAQQRFVADASHELRAPLTAIQGNLSFLQQITRTC